MGRLVVLSGPSCAGKGPLCAALEKYHPELGSRLEKLVLHNSRAMRPVESDGVDYHFRSREEIEALRADPGFAVMDVRGDLQALDLAGLECSLEAGDVLFEGNPFTGVHILESEAASRVEVLGIFLAPFSRAEIVRLKAPESGVNLSEFTAEVMRRKILRRTGRQKGRVPEEDLADVERRCTSALGELALAHRFDYVIPNHDGEDSENWFDFGYPIGDALRALQCFAALLNGEVPAAVEKWDPGLVPGS